MYRSFDSGYDAYTRYSHLFEEKERPFIRASASQRVIDTCSNFSSGMQAAASGLDTGRVKPDFVVPPPITITESPESNNTLHTSNCPASNMRREGPARSEWLEVWAPRVATRLNAGVHFSNESTKLEVEDVENLMDMCIFESLVFARDAKQMSSFCILFNEEEWVYFEYGFDLEKYYYTGCVLCS
jgi:hypothetical protein